MVGRSKYDYHGESAIITGSTKGIGRGIAEGLAAAGADLVINSRTEVDVTETAADLNERSTGDVIGITADMAVPQDIEHLITTAIDEFGEIDLLVNNAAVWPHEESLVEASIEDWDLAMDVNVRAQYYASKLVAIHMIEEDIEGSIINHTSQTGDRRTGRRGFYGISNSSINGLTWRMAHELAEHGIRMNAISTDATETHQLRYEAEMVVEEDANRSVDDILQEWGEDRPIGRLGKPADLANAVLYLASDSASYVVGEILRVSGGGNLE